MMNKKLLAAVLALTMLLGLMPGTAFATDPPHSHPICGAACSGHTEHHENVTWTEWDGTTPLSTGNYYLENDVEFSNTLEIEGTVNFCLNGHTLTGIRSTGYNGTFYLDASTAVLTICDCSENNSGKFDGSFYPINNAKGTVSLYGGTITGGTSDRVIQSNSGTTLTITGNTKIIGTNGMAVASGGTLTVTDGVTITSAGIAISNGGNATISGGTISGELYGIYMSNIDATLKMIGNPKISGTTADLSLYSNKAYNGPPVKTTL